MTWPVADQLGVNLSTSDFTTSSWVNSLPCCGQDTAVPFHFLPCKAVCPSLRVACQYGTMFVSYSFINSAYKHTQILKISPLWLRKKTSEKMNNANNSCPLKTKCHRKQRRKFLTSEVISWKLLPLKWLHLLEVEHHITWSCQQKTTVVLRGTYSICSIFRIKLFFQRHWKFGKVTWSFTFIPDPIQGCRTLDNHTTTVSEYPHKGVYSQCFISRLSKAKFSLDISMRSDWKYAVGVVTL